jgi:hypothetical protein
MARYRESWTANRPTCNRLTVAQSAGRRNRHDINCCARYPGDAWPILFGSGSRGLTTLFTLWRGKTASMKKAALHRRRESIPILRSPPEPPGYCRHYDHSLFRCSVRRSPCRYRDPRKPRREQLRRPRTMQRICAIITEAE